MASIVTKAPAVSRWIGRWAIVLAQGCLLACEQPNGTVETMLMLNGKTVEEHLKSRPRAVVLVYKAEMCFSCSTAYSDWEAAAQSQSAELLLFLDRHPTKETDAALRRLRISVDGVVPARWPSSKVPTEYLFENGRLIASNTGEGALTTRDLRKKWEPTF